MSSTKPGYQFNPTDIKQGLENLVNRNLGSFNGSQAQDYAPSSVAGDRVRSTSQVYPDGTVANAPPTTGNPAVVVVNPGQQVPPPLNPNQAGYYNNGQYGSGSSTSSTGWTIFWIIVVIIVIIIIVAIAYHLWSNSKRKKLVKVSQYDPRSPNYIRSDKIPTDMY